MRSISVACLIASVAVATDMNQLEFGFMKWLSQHNKSYGTVQEYQMRLGTWLKVEEFISEVNAPGSGHGHTAGHNRLSDYTTEEYKKMLSLAGKPKGKDTYDLEMFQDNRDDTAANLANVDWRGHGCVTDVKDQGACGSCYAFSAIETVESNFCINNNILWTLSPQQIVDCSGYPNAGCEGGLYSTSWAYLMNHGSEPDQLYPYDGVQGDCYYNSANGKVRTDNEGIVISSHPQTMKQALTLNPISVSIQADQLVFQTYQSGVITQFSRCGNSLDHAVQAVGFNQTASTPYWIVRNSWGAGWGDAGYVNIQITDCAHGGVCGICMDPEYVNTSAW